MSDSTEFYRRARVTEINSGAVELPEKTWTTEQLREEFTVTGFLAPFVVVTRKSDKVVGTLEFKNSPRVYFNWQEDS